MGSSLRRKGGIYWFRRRVPKHLVPVLGRGEINRTLATSCYQTAQTRAREAWLATERILAGVGRPLSEDQAALIIERLRTEPVWDSPTTEDISEQILIGDWSMADILFRHAETLVPLLPEEDRMRVVYALERINKAMSSPHEVVQAECQCIAGLSGADPVGPGRPGSMGSVVSTTSGAGGR